MIRSFLAVVSVAAFADAATAQFAYPLPGGASTCANGQCRPVQAVTGAVHNAVVAGGETIRSHVAPAFASAPCRPAVTFVPGQPLRNAVRAVRQVVGR
jgi:hypothetical protein